MNQSRPKGICLNHVALNITQLEACKHFYAELLGMKIVWEPDADNIYLSSGKDNLALHRAQEPISDKGQHLDHIGFGLQVKEDVDKWYDFLKTHQVKIFREPKDHRDGSRSFYCQDPDGNVIQMIWLGY